MQQFLTKSVMAFLATVLLVGTVPVAVMAEDGDKPENNTTTSQKIEDNDDDEMQAEHNSRFDNARDLKERTQIALSDRQESAKKKLEGAKLRSCQNREKGVTNIMKRIADRGQKQVNLFSKIAERTEAFYTDKGLTLANYDALVAEVNAKKAAAQTQVDKVDSTVVEFKCDGDNPKGVASTFKTAKNDMHEALKAYKTSVKNLIVGVKSVASSEGSEQ